MTTTLPPLNLSSISENKTGEEEDETNLSSLPFHETYYQRANQQVPLVMEQLDTRNGERIWVSESRVHEAMRGKYDIRPKTPLEIRFQRAGMKSARYDSIPSQPYLFQITCVRLPRSNKSIECDPMCIVLRKGTDALQDEWNEVFRTERIENNSNPHFERKFVVNFHRARTYRGVEEQKVRFIIVDDEYAWRPSKALSYKQHALATIETTLDEIVDANEIGPNNVFMVPLEEPEKKKVRYGTTQDLGNIIIHSKRIDFSIKCRPNGAQAVVDGEIPVYRPRVDRWIDQFTSQALILFEKFAALGQAHSTESSRSSTLDTQEFLCLLASLGILSVGSAENLDVGIQTQRFDRKLGLITKTNAFSVFQLHGSNEACKGTMELDFETFRRCIFDIAALLKQNIESKHGPSQLGRMSKESQGVASLKQEEEEEGVALPDQLATSSLKKLPATPRKFHFERLSSKRATPRDSISRIREEMRVFSDDRRKSQVSDTLTPRKPPTPRKLKEVKEVVSARGFNPERHLVNLFDIAASSQHVDIQRYAAPAIAALAVSSNGSKIGAFGGIKVLKELLVESPNLSLKSDCLDAMTQLLSKNVQSAKQFIEMDGINHLLQNWNVTSINIRRKSVEALEAVLMHNIDIEDNFNNSLIDGIYKYVSGTDITTSLRASKIFLRLCRAANGKGEVWQCFRFDSKVVNLREAFCNSAYNSNKLVHGIVLFCHNLLMDKFEFGPTVPSLQSFSQDSMKPLPNPPQASPPSQIRSGGVKQGIRQLKTNILESFTTMLNAPNSLNHFYLEGLLLSGLFETIAERFEGRGGESVDEEDLHELRCITRMVTTVAEKGKERLPPRTVRTAVQAMQRLKNMAPFCWMSEDALLMLAEIGKYCQFHTGDLVVRQGEENVSGFLVISGSLQTVYTSVRHYKVKNLLKIRAGDVFGSFDLRDQEPWSASVFATSSCNLLKISKVAITLVAQRFPEFQRAYLLPSTSRPPPPPPLPSPRRPDPFSPQDTPGTESDANYGLPDIMVDRKKMLRSICRRQATNFAKLWPRFKFILENILNERKSLKFSITEIETVDLILTILISAAYPHEVESVHNVGMLSPLLDLMKHPNVHVSSRAAVLVSWICEHSSLRKSMAANMRSEPVSSLIDTLLSRTNSRIGDISDNVFKSLNSLTEDKPFAVELLKHNLVPKILTSITSCTAWEEQYESFTNSRGAELCLTVLKSCAKFWEGAEEMVKCNLMEVLENMLRRMRSPMNVRKCVYHIDVLLRTIMNTLSIEFGTTPIQHARRKLSVFVPEVPVVTISYESGKGEPEDFKTRVKLLFKDIQLLIHRIHVAEESMRDSEDGVEGYRQKSLFSGRKLTLANVFVEEMKGGSMSSAHILPVDKQYSFEDRKRHISRLIAIAIDQAEESWDSNVGWLMGTQNNRVSKALLEEWSLLRELSHRRAITESIINCLSQEMEKKSNTSNRWRLSPVVLCALQRVNSTLSTFEVQRESDHAMEKLGVKHKHNKWNRRKSLSEDLLLALSPVRAGQELARAINIFLNLIQRRSSAIERFRAAARAVATIFRISKSMQTVKAMRIVLDGEAMEKAAISLQRIARKYMEWKKDGLDSPM